LDGLNGSVASVSLQNSNKEKLLAFQKEEKVWILESKNKITSFISQFEFKCKNYCINPLYQDIKHIGRHVKVIYFN